MSVSRQLVEIIDSDACASITVAPSTRLALVEVVLELARALRQAAKAAQREQEHE